MAIIIDQPAGLGDIFFLQKAVKFLSEKYGDVIWPIDPFLYNEVQQIDSPIKWVIGKPNDNAAHLAIFSSADRLYPNESVMEAKYKMIGLDFSDWKDYFHFKRDGDKEKALIKILGIERNQKYSLVNDKFGSYPNVNQKQGVKEPKFKPVHLEKIEGFTLIDWSGVICGASEIITVDTSINYIIEKLSLKQECLDNLHLYSRFTPANFKHIQNLFKKPWIKHNA